MSAWLSVWIVKYLYAHKKSLGTRMLALCIEYPELFDHPWPLVEEVVALKNFFFMAVAFVCSCSPIFFYDYFLIMF